MRSWSIRSAVLVGVAALAACAPPSGELVATTTAPPMTRPTATDVGCPAGGSAALPELTGSTSPAEAVSAYLAAGGDPTALVAGLFERGWVTPTSTIVWTDIDGDSDLDLAAGLTGAPGAETGAEQGSVYLWRCDVGTYTLTEMAPPRAESRFPSLREARDLTADGLPELVVAYPVCGAHTCFAQFAVFQWDGRQMLDRFEGRSDDIPTPQLVVHADRPDLPAEIEITAAAVGSVGAGPHRVWSRLWTWDAAARAFLPGPMVVEAPRYRIHVIHDADDAYARNELAAANELYRRAIEDDSLLDWPSPGDRRAALAAYAAYRRVLTYLVEGDAAAAQLELGRRLSGSDPTTVAYAALAQQLIGGHAAGSLEEACAAAAEFAGEHPEAVLAPLDFGYGNRPYTAEDICPTVGF